MAEHVANSQRRLEFTETIRSSRPKVEPRRFVRVTWQECETDEDGYHGVGMEQDIRLVEGRLRLADGIARPGPAVDVCWRNGRIQETPRVVERY